jgi:Mechanosensitive ion channel.
VNGRRLTNLGLFRKYIEFYLQNNPNVDSANTLMVRLLEPNEKGIPMEIYGFSKEKRWVQYESILGDIFDHLLAVVPEFELKVFQNPSGDDFKNLVNR